MSKMQTYKSPMPAEVGGHLYKAGEPFVTDAEPAEEWEKITEQEAVIEETAQNKVPDHADLESLPLTALKAVAFLRHVQGIDKLDNDGLKTAIRASYEPRL
jgi:hypothetical protein